MITKYTVSPKNGLQTIFQIGQNNVSWLGLDILRLDPGETWQAELTDLEAVLIALSGRFSVSVNTGQPVQWNGVGGRADIFSGSPWAVYAPRRSKIKVTAETQFEVAISKAPCDKDLPPALVKPCRGW